MASSDPLAQLNPLRDPSAIDWWPPAFGWWAILGILGIVLIFTFLTLRCRYKARAYRRQALSVLERLAETYAYESTTKEFPEKVNRLLKVVALESYPRSEVASLSGGTWAEFLTADLERTSNTDFLKELYSPKSSIQNNQEIYEFARNWIKNHRGKQC